MAIQKIITHSKKDRDGDILAIGKLYEPPISKEEAIRNIESNTYEYYSQHPNCPIRSKIEVVYDRFKGKYIRTILDGTTMNNLDNLPNLY